MAASSSSPNSEEAMQLLLNIEAATPHDESSRQSDCSDCDIDVVGHHQADTLPFQGHEVVVGLQEPDIQVDWLMKASENPIDIQIQSPDNPTDLQIQSPDNPIDLQIQAPHNPTDLQIQAPHNPTDLQIQAPDNPTDLQIQAPDNPTDLQIQAPDNPTDLQIQAPDNPIDLHIQALDNPTEPQIQALDNSTDLQVQAPNNPLDLQTQALDKPLDLHIRTRDKAHVCDTCSKVYKTKTGLRKHCRKHSGLYPYVCDCGKGFSERRCLLEHLCVHTNNGLKKCKLCGFEPRTFRGLKWHEQNHGSETHKCPTCSKEYKSKLSLKQHEKSSHEVNFICPICEKPFGMKSRFKSHLETHSSDKPHKCSTCNFESKRKSDLKRHIAHKHTLLPLFICQLCGSGFKTQGDLTRHGKRKSSCVKEKSYSSIWADVV
ncbi:zinc finger protein 878-like [Ptychodera flava]|uniref:zinc finger protein 878-like n=1 Tax=Ptychodera flava TaxID=63121 RepID=UPI00396A5E9B